MANGERNDRAIQDEHAADARAQAEVKHSATFVAAERLHAGVVHDADRATERGRIVEIYPAVTQVEGFGNGMSVKDLPGVANGNAIELRLGRKAVDLVEELGGR